MDHDDIFDKLPNDGVDDAGDLGDLNPFSDIAGPDLFEKLMEDGQKSLWSMNTNNCSFNSGSNAQDLLESALNKSDNSLLNTADMEIEPLKGDRGSQNEHWDVPSVSSSAFHGGNNSQGYDWIQNGNMISGFSNKQPMNIPSFSSALDAAPLNISLGRGNLGSTSLRRKGSITQLNASIKQNSIHKASKASTNFKASKSEGLLARALKAKYNSSGQLNYNMNAQAAVAIAEAGGSNLLADNSPSMSAIDPGSKNASWRVGSETTSPSSMLHQMLLNKNRSRSISTLTPCDSMPAMFSANRKLGSSRSKSSMQDLLRLSRKQSKTQSMLRQSFAQSLMKQTSSNSLREASGKVDVSSLLPPHHTSSRKSLNSPDSFAGGVGGRANATFSTNNQASTGGTIAAEGLLHQSCRLYPTTDAVVESALRIDPAAVRRAVATTVDNGSAGKATNVYGYPINVAITHGGSMGVLKMIAEAAPDVLTQKDGMDGSGSLGVALSAKCNLDVVGLLLQVNPRCAQVADRRGNYPLHVAVSQGLSLNIVKRIHMAYPSAQEMRNFHSNTPLDIAQRSTRCPEDVMNFLQSSAYSKLEHLASHIDQNSGNLEDGLDDIMQTNL